MLKKRTIKNIVREWVSDYASQKFSVWAKNLSFLDDPRFRKSINEISRAYEREYPGAVIHDRRWTLHIVFWAAQQGASLEGDFVECGVYRGETSLAVCDHVAFGALDKKFYLCDTFSGMPVEILEGEELERALMNNRVRQLDTYDNVARIFSPYENVEIVKGMVPQTLYNLNLDAVSFLHLDMNNAQSEVEALRYLWPKLTPGAIVVMDDYGWRSHHQQKEAIDALCDELGTSAAVLPTGQGLIVKPSAELH